jgi:hypothetical protein
MKAVSLRTPGYKVRVVGVPDARTFVEGSWIRGSSRLMPPGHWTIDPESRDIPCDLHYRRGHTFRSLDLSKATDGLSHAAIEIIIEALVRRGAIRSADHHMARRSLGLVGDTIWSFPDPIGDVVFSRGSPMGTPLSFVVLSWVSAWAVGRFSRSLTHGDDAVGRHRIGSDALNVYAERVASVGAQLNKGKTFRADHAWTACEVLALPREHAEDRMTLFFPPSIPPPDLRAPVEADPRLENLWLRRMERVMKSRFPWVKCDPRLHLPVEIGGLGYTGRGLAVGRSLRSRLGALVSRGPSAEIGAALIGKKPFREMGLFPHPLIRVPKPRAYWSAAKAVDRELAPLGADLVSVPLESFETFKCQLIESELRLIEGEKFRRKRVAGRPDRSKRSTVFRRLGVKPARPLTRSGGLASLRRWALACRQVRVTVDQDIASEIRERIPDPSQPTQGGKGMQG